MALTGAAKISLHWLVSLHWNKLTFLCIKVMSVRKIVVHISSKSLRYFKKYTFLKDILHETSLNYHRTWCKPRAMVSFVKADKIYYSFICLCKVFFMIVSLNWFIVHLSLLPVWIIFSLRVSISLRTIEQIIDVKQGGAQRWEIQLSINENCAFFFLCMSRHQRMCHCWKGFISMSKDLKQ